MSIAELRQLPPDEKSRIIEALWSDLAVDDAALKSPAWHEEKLRKTEAEFAPDAFPPRAAAGDVNLLRTEGFSHKDDRIPLLRVTGANEPVRARREHWQELTSRLTALGRPLA